MTAFQVILVTEAQADIKRLNPAIQTRILDKLEWMGGKRRTVTPPVTPWTGMERVLQAPCR